MTFVKTQTTEERFWAKVDKRGPDDCWLWTASDNSRGRPQFWADGKTRLAHRVVWEFEHGPIPAGAEIHHKCLNWQCVNPAHLELMPTHHDHWLATKRDKRGPIALNAHKTHCERGHELVGDNVVEIAAARRGNRIGPMRRCRECDRMRGRRRDMKRRQQTFPEGWNVVEQGGFIRGTFSAVKGALSLARTIRATENRPIALMLIAGGCARKFVVL